MDLPPLEPPHTPDPGPFHSGPVFTDPSGQRRRLMKLLGAAASILLVGALVLTGLSLFGGPGNPFSMFGPHAHHPGGGRAGQHGHGAPGRHAPGSGGPGSRSPSASPSRSGSRSPSPSASPTSPAGSPSSSPTPTNGGGRTPPGRTKTPHPRPSPSSTHAK